MLRYCRPRGLRPESMPEFTTVAVVSSGNTLDWLDLVMLAIAAKMPAPNAPPSPGIKPLHTPDWHAQTLDAAATRNLVWCDDY